MQVATLQQHQPSSSSFASSNLESTLSLARFSTDSTVDNDAFSAPNPFLDSTNPRMEPHSVGMMANGAGKDVADSSDNFLVASIRKSSTSLPATTTLPVTRSISTSALTRPSSDSNSTSSATLPTRSGAATTATGQQQQQQQQLKPLTPSALLLSQQLPITRTVSSPPLSRSINKTPLSNGVSGHSLAVSSAAGVSRSPALTPGFNTPLPNQSSTHTYHHQHHAPTLHNLEESYVGKVSLKLSEAVNKVFLPLPAAMLATMGVVGIHHSLVCNGSTAPKVLRAKEFAELLVSELHSAVHDTYLLRTLLRSSYLKTMSLFLTRLTALVVPSALPNPFPLIQSNKDYDIILPAPFRFNLLIVRCAHEVKQGLERAGKGLPNFVEETLRPWREKLDQVVARVMDPVVAVLRGNVIETCRRGRLVEAITPAASSTLTMASSIIPSLPNSSQIRSLSMGRSATPMIDTLSITGSAPTIAGGGPIWIKDLAAVLDSTNILFNKLECGLDSDKWRASIGTCAVWKGCLALSNRRIALEDAIGAASPSTSTRSLFKSTKRSTSPPSTRPSTPEFSSPPLHSSQLPLSNGSTTHDVAFLRLLAELELLESRLIAFHSTLSAAPVSLADPVTLSGKCVDARQCSLCRTGRTFDAESSDDEDSEDGRSTSSDGLAQSAMREAMQVVSALIVVVRANASQGVLRDALLANAGSHAPISTHDDASPAPPAVCPTLSHALDTLPTLLLLHVLIARLPTALNFREPHHIWSLEWNAYERELRGFAAAEEWTEEIGEEIAMEIESVLASFETRKEVMGERAREGLRVLRDAVRIKVGVDVADF